MNRQTEKSDSDSTRAFGKSLHAEPALDPVELYRRLELLATAEKKARTHLRMEREQHSKVNGNVAQENNTSLASQEYCHAPQFAARQFMATAGSRMRKSQQCNTTSKSFQQLPKRGTNSCAATQHQSKSSPSSKPRHRANSTSGRLVDHQRQPDKQYPCVATIRQSPSRTASHTRKSEKYPIVSSAKCLRLFGVQDTERCSSSTVEGLYVRRNVKATAQQLADRRGWTQKDEGLGSVQPSATRQHSNSRINVTSKFRAMTAKFIYRT